MTRGVSGGADDIPNNDGCVKISQWPVFRETVHVSTHMQSVCL